jgi:glutamate synthase (NADPH/NADH) large chain
MVDLESVWSWEDQDVLNRLLTRHVELTGSERAKDILNSWENRLPYFVKVFPIDYRKALERMRHREDRGSETLSATEEVYPHTETRHR